MKYLDLQIENTLRRLQSQPLLLLLVAMFFMGGTMKREERSMSYWAIQSLLPLRYPRIDKT
jgi:hypothetical protein